MHLFRQTWTCRAVAVVLLWSTLPALAVPLFSPERRSRAEAFESWLVGQMTDAPDGAVSHALGTARKSAAVSFESYLLHFVTVFEAENPARPLSTVFAAGEVSDRALVRLLYGRFRQILDGTRPAEALLVSASSAVTPLPGSVDGPRAFFAGPDRLYASAARSLVADAPALVLPSIRALWGAVRPLGP